MVERAKTLGNLSGSQSIAVSQPDIRQAQKTKTQQGQGLRVQNHCFASGIRIAHALAGSLS